MGIVGLTARPSVDDERRDLSWGASVSAEANPEPGESFLRPT